MKVCVFGLRGFPKVEGGVEKHCEFLYSKIQNDVDLTVIRRKPFAKKAKSNFSKVRFVDIMSTKIKGFEVVLHSFLATRKAAKLKPDVVHIHNIGPALFIKHLYKKGIPVVLTYHSPNYEHSKWGGFATKLLLHCERVALKYASKIIFVNSFQMGKYSKAIKRKSVFIPNGINRPELIDNTDYLDEIGVEKNKYVLAVGRITPEKGFDVLIKGFEKSKHKGYKLVIAGGVDFENGHMDTLRKIASKDVIFTGNVYGDQLKQLYQNAALSVLSSYNEGFPLVLLEAMSYNLDIIVSDIPATHLVDLNLDDYYPCGNYKELGKKITKRLRMPRRRKYDLDQFDWENVAEKTVDVYKSVCRKR